MSLKPKDLELIQSMIHECRDEIEVEIIETREYLEEMINAVDSRVDTTEEQIGKIFSHLALNQ